MGVPDGFERQTYEAEFGEEGGFRDTGARRSAPDGTTLASVVEIRGDWADDSIVLSRGGDAAERKMCFKRRGTSRILRGRRTVGR